jgi:ABC-type tungstate transport system substrate-binding protein
MQNPTRLGLCLFVLLPKTNPEGQFRALLNASALLL